MGFGTVASCYGMSQKKCPTNKPTKDIMLAKNFESIISFDFLRLFQHHVVSHSAIAHLQTYDSAHWIAQSAIMI